MQAAIGKYSLPIRVIVQDILQGYILCQGIPKNPRCCEIVENGKENHPFGWVGSHKKVNIIIRHNLQKTGFWLK